MTTGAWLMLVCVWGVVFWFAGRSFWKVATSAPRRESPEDRANPPPSS